MSNYLDDLVNDIILEKTINTNLLNTCNVSKNKDTDVSTVDTYTEEPDKQNIFSMKNDSTKEYDSKFQKYYNILNDNNEFIYQTNNTILTLTLLNSLFTMFYYNLNIYNLSFFVLNIIFFSYYNYLNIENTCKLVNNNNLINIFKYANVHMLFLLQLFRQKLNVISYYCFDRFFSKNTQVLLRIVYNISKIKAINIYKMYKNKLLNPPLLTQTTKENVYSVSFYLNDVTYKIPIIEPRFNFEKKQQPLMILNKKEEDITQSILQYMGPNNDFFGMVLKPKHLNEKTLNFMMEDGTEFNIDENDMIVF
jgi:hypothetical protein